MDLTWFKLNHMVCVCVCFLILQRWYRFKRWVSWFQTTTGIINWKTSKHIDETAYDDSATHTWFNGNWLSMQTEISPGNREPRFNLQRSQISDSGGAIRCYWNLVDLFLEMLSGWLVTGTWFFLFSHIILGMSSSSQLTSSNLFQGDWNHQPVM